MESEETRQESRERRLRRKRHRMPQHGKGIIRIYRDATLKRLKHRKKGGNDG